MRETYCFEGFCNRVNAMVSSMLKWPLGFLLRWHENEHCPCPFSDLFHGLPNVTPTKDTGDWGYFQYKRGKDKHCYYFLDCVKPITEVKKAYSKVITSLKAYNESFSEPLDMIALSYRQHYNWERASVGSCLDVVRDISGRTGVKRVFVNCEDEETNTQICKTLQEQGYEVLWDDSFIDHDLDRSKESVHEFIKTWLTLTRCKWAVTNAVSSTILDASRALGNEVWAVGDVAQRHNNHCALFGRYGQNLFTIKPDERR